MSSVDNRIVKIEFENTEFETNIAQSEESLNSFQKTLNKFGDTGASSSALDKIASKFTNLGIIGVTALQNITDSAINLGKELVKSLTIDPVSTGWSKLEQQTKAVGTLVSQGFDISEVNDQLERLQWYTDETSYNFNDMLTAVSKFTAQGQSLSDSVSALEGIANWAAMAGQNATAGSSAMRELSQAAGVGYIRYQDWSSIQTLMMDYDSLRDMILNTAVSMGTLKKNTDGTYQSLVALTDQGATSFTKAQLATYLTTGRWFTTDVLMNVLKQFSEAVDPVYEYVRENNVTAAEAIEALKGQISDVALGFFEAAQEARTLGDALDSVKEGVASGWKTTFGILVGDYEEQRKLWTDLSDRLYEVFVESGNARNEILRQWADLGGREKLIQSLWNIFDAGVKIIETIKTAWQSVFPTKTAEDLLSITDKFEKFTKKLIISDKTAIKIGRTLQGVFSLIRLGKDILTAILVPIASLLGSSDGLLDSILTITQAIGDSITNFVYWAETVGLFEAISKGIVTAFTAIGNAVSWAWDKLSSLGDLISTYISNGETWKAVAILAGIIVALLAIRKLINWVSNIGVGNSMSGILAIGDWFETAKVIATMSASILALAYSISLLKDVNIVKLGAIFGMLSVFAVEMAAIYVALVAVSAAFPEYATPIIHLLEILAVVMAVSAVALVIFTKELRLLADLIADRGPEIANGIIVISEALAIAIVNISEGIAEGIKLVISSFSTSLVILGKGIAESVTEIKNALKSPLVGIGEYMVEGIFEGMTNSKSTGIIANAADILLGIIPWRWGIRSPSTKGEYFGEMMDLGVANGMEDSQNYINSAVETLNANQQQMWEQMSVNLANTFNTGLSNNISLDLFDETTSTLLDEMGIDSSSIRSSENLGVSVANSVINSASTEIANSAENVDLSLTGMLKSLFSGDWNYAAANFGNAMAEATITPYANKMIAGMQIVNEYAKENTEIMSKGITESVGYALANATSMTEAANILNKAEGQRAQAMMDQSKHASVQMGRILNSNPDIKLPFLDSIQDLYDSNRALRSINNTVSKISDNTPSWMLVGDTKLRQELNQLFSGIDVSINRTSSTSHESLEKVKEDIKSVVSSITDAADKPITIVVDADTSSVTEAADELTASVSDYELSLAQLIRRYSTNSLSKVNKNGEEVWTWMYNGPLWGVTDDGQEWVYEGPRYGTYDPERDAFYAEINGQLVEVSYWLQAMEQLYSSGSFNAADLIYAGTTDLLASIQGQTEQSKLDNTNIIELLKQLGITMENVNNGIAGLSEDLSNLDLYLDGDTLVGGITNRMDSSLGTKQRYVSQGVLR